MFTVPMYKTLPYCLLSNTFTRPMYVFRRYLNLGILDGSVTVSTHLVRQITRNWEVWDTNIEKSSNHRMIQQLS
jgi:hypothetical protein